MFKVGKMVNHYDLFKVLKMTAMFFDLFKVSKMTNHYDLFKLAVLNKAIQGAFFKSQKSKNRLKRHRYLRKAVANKAIHGTFLSLKKVKRRVYGNYGSIFACDLEKCPGSLYFPLLRQGFNTFKSK